MRLLRFLPVISVMGLIFYLSSLPGNTLPLVMPKVLSFDKLLHIFAYGVLAATALFAVPVELRQRRPLRVSLLIVLFCLLYGISDEAHQFFVPFRSPSCWDILADTIGASLAVLVQQARSRAAKG